ncbi:hypothetical protein [Methylibium petroleiphilum]|uniref:Uncharacterized protein n=1 Tax=Methylibium petroleiphilum (strain ATCC BAA-1232 / LMG 22953 / PM1) TaxID=420662 RepID=A2SMK6_METPP|nr:hypothetical protein [Methylibium petroleiphilum]ABM96795.1 hypothetical protein Mpe_B0014 [Methylibium petroleiphilum PM1]
MATELLSTTLQTSASQVDWVTQLAGGANLVDGKPTWEHAETAKHDLNVMLRCCEAELETMQRTGLVAAPFYFERAAILLRKAKEFEREVIVCERYLRAVDAFYASAASSGHADVRKGPTCVAIQRRLVKARELAGKLQTST